MIALALLALSFIGCTWCVLQTRDDALIVSWFVVCVAMGLALPTIVAKLI